MGLAAPFDKQEVKKEEEMVSQSKIKIGIKGFRAEDCSTKQIEFPVNKTEQRWWASLPHKIQHICDSMPSEQKVTIKKTREQFQCNGFTLICMK